MCVNMLQHETASGFSAYTSKQQVNGVGLESLVLEVSSGHSNCNESKTRSQVSES